MSIKIALLAALVCFIMPFVSVSCMGETESYNGLHVMIGVSYDAEDMGINSSYLTSSSASEEYDSGFNIFLIASLLLTVGSVLVLWKTKNVVISAGMSVVAALMHLGFRLFFFSYYDELESMKNAIDFKFGYTFSLLLLLYAAAALVWVVLKKNGLLPKKET